jgi:hypothetical protein
MDSKTWIRLRSVERRLGGPQGRLLGRSLAPVFPRFPQARCGCFGSPRIDILFCLLQTGNLATGWRLHRGVVCANVKELYVSSGASRWPCGLPRLREVGSWFVGSDVVPVCAPLSPL